MTDLDKRALRAALLDAEPWLGATDVGPQAVSAGPCDRCQDAPRLLPTCGPTTHEAVCRSCAAQIADDGWCDGHLADGRAARAWAESLPDHWADTVVLWWVATGELRSGTVVLRDPDDVDPRVRALLPG